MKNNKKNLFSNVFSDTKKNKNGYGEDQKDGKIDLGRFSESEENEKRQNILKILFKNRKRGEKPSSEEERPTVDVEAKRISERFNIAHNVLWIVLLLFVVVFCAFFSEGITTGNMQHIFRNMFSSGETSESVSSYYFSINENSVFGEISGVPVIAGSDRIIVFSPDGSHEYSEESEYSLPAMVTSNKYVLVYDRGGSAYGIYNEFGICHSESAGNKIYGGTIAGSGAYAIARKGSEYMTEISVYTPNFEIVTVIKKNNAYASMDIKAGGGEIVLVTYAVLPDGSVESELMLLRSGEKTPRALVTLENGTPVECKYLDNGQIAVLFDKAFCIFDKDGNKLSSCAVNMDDIYMYDISDDGHLMCAERIYGSSNTFKIELIKLDGVGMKKSEYTLKEEPIELNMYEDYAYIITERKVMRHDADNFDEMQIFESDRRLLSIIFISGDEYVCTSDSLFRIDLKNDSGS